MTQNLNLPELLSGVVHGSGIGPIMFIVFINDLIDVGLHERYGVTCKLLLMV